MVKYSVPTPTLDAVFYSLSDPTRRDIVSRVAKHEYSVGELVANYDISFPAVSKHLKVLEKSRLIRKRKEGKKHMISLVPGTLEVVDQYLEQYRQMWQSRHDKLAAILEKDLS